MTIAIEAPVTGAKESRKLKIEYGYQACSDSFCLFPKSNVVEIPFHFAGTGKQDAIVEGDDSLIPAGADFSQSDFISSTLQGNWLKALIIVFFAGLLTSFTPCIFPMIPITLAVLGHGSENRSRAQNFVLSLFYVFGIATTYSLLGLAAASSGAVFGATLGNPWILGTMCVLFLAMSLSMYGLYEIQVPAFVRNGLGNKKTSPGYVGSYLTGLFAGIVASPCVGPVLVGILAYVATTQSKLYGFVLLFSYAMGLGLIFLLLGAFTELTRKLPRSGPWLEGVKFVLGSLMLGAFYYYLGLLVPQRLHDGVLATGMIVLASVYGAFGALRVDSAFRKIRKGFAQAVLIIGFGYLVLSVFDLRPMLQGQMLSAAGVPTAGPAWVQYDPKEFQRALSSGQPIVMDFWADWCAACHELEEITFANTEVKRALMGYKLFKFDATKDSPELRDMKKRFNIQGLPTLVFFDKKGTWHSELSLTEFENPDKFLLRLKKLN